MNFVWQAAVKDLRRQFRDPVGLVLWVSIPLMIGGLISLTMGGQSGPSLQAKVLVADQDESFVSKTLLQLMNQGGTGELITIEKVEVESGRSRLSGGDGSALLVIPEGFGRAVLREKPSELLLLTNPSQNILPGIVKETVQTFVDSTFYLHRLVGPELQGLTDAIASGPIEEEDVMPVVLGLLGALRTSSRYLFPPIIEVQIEQETESDSAEEPVSIATLFLPGILLMGMLFMAQGLSEDIWKEKVQGTLSRAVTAPPGASALMAGKLVSTCVLVLIVTLLILGLGIVYTGLPLRLLPVAWLFAGSSGVLFFLIMVFLQTLASSQRAGSILTNSIVMPLLMIGGSFFPSELMPAWMRVVGGWTPNGWVLERVKDILLERCPWTSTLGSFAVVFALSAITLWICSLRIKRGFVRS
jgi:ABC-2 type transport system permease protein